MRPDNAGPGRKGFARVGRVTGGLIKETIDRAVTPQRGVFEGPNALRDFLNPDNHRELPLVELPARLNPFRENDVRIFAKLMYLLPLLNIKSLTAINMLLEAEAAGDLEGVETLVESSSGNTAFALGILAEHFGISRVVAMVPWDLAPGKLDLLRLCGVEPRFVRDTGRSPSGIAQAREIGGQPGWVNLAQYENDANPRAFEKWLAPEMWEQTGGRLTVFVAGLGTTGTLVGASRFFRTNATGVTVVGAMCDPDSAVPGLRSERALGEIAFPWRAAMDGVVEVGTKESFKRSLELCRCGILAGPSSGLALAGLLKFLEGRKDSGLDSLRNRDGEVLATFVCADSPLPYLDKYSTHLDPSDF